MQWWTDISDWFFSTHGQKFVYGALIPFVAIVVAGIVAALIGRGSARRVIALSDREVRVAAVTALISSASKAAVWNTLPIPEQQHIDHLIGDAEIRLRMLPIAGTSLAADWARHEIADMKRNAVSFSFQAEQTLIVFRDRMIEWQARPSRAKRLFKNDLDSWAYDSSLSEQELVHQQQVWAAQQAAATDAAAASAASAPVAPAVAATPAPTPTVAPTAPVAAPPAVATTAPEDDVTPHEIVEEPAIEARSSRPAMPYGQRYEAVPTDTPSEGITAQIEPETTEHESANPEHEVETDGEANAETSESHDRDPYRS